MKETPIPIDATRDQILALTQRAYQIGLKEVIKGNADPALKRQLARTRANLKKGT